MTLLPARSRSRSARPTFKPNGFTLIELMITVVIVGILAAVAYPSYMSQVRKSRRSDAVAAMSAIQLAQERWRANNTSYATGAALGIAATTPGGYYTLAVEDNTGTGYKLTATAVAGKSQSGDTACTPLVMTVTNGNAAKTPAGCWSQ